MMVEWHSRTAKPFFFHILLPLVLLHSHNVNTIVVHAFACHLIISNKRTTRTSFGIHPTNSFTLTTVTLQWRSPALLQLQQATTLFNDRVTYEQSNLKNTQLHAQPRHRHSLQHEPMQPEIEHDVSSSRRSFLSQCVCHTPMIVSSWCLHPVLADAAEATTIMVDLSSDKLQGVLVKDEANVGERSAAFHSAAFGLEEYNNSIVASRDTNISPKEVYDTISSDYLRGAYDAAAINESAWNDNESLNSSSSSRNTSNRNRKQRMTPKALDVGAGAGVSTEILYRMGFHTIDALDWSGKAWERFVVSDPYGVCPQEARMIKSFFVLVVTPLAVQPQGNITVTLPGDAEKDAEAKNGITKLSLFLIAADCDFDAGTITNVRMATRSPGMDCVVASGRAAQAQAYSDLIRKACISAKEQSPWDARGTQVSLIIVQTMARRTTKTTRISPSKPATTSSTLMLGAF